MKKKIILLLLLVVSMIWLTTGCEKNDEKKATIYMFRGQGCAYCRKFLNFLNSISEEYGKYFELVSFEVWNDADNKELMDKVASVTGVEAGGVPYIIIGDRVFGGYAESYDDAIKAKIKEQYEDPSYDVFEELKKKESEEKEETTEDDKKEDTKKDDNKKLYYEKNKHLNFEETLKAESLEQETNSKDLSNKATVVMVGVMVLVGTIVCLINSNSNREVVLNELNKLATKEEEKNMKKKKSNE